MNYRVQIFTNFTQIPEIFRKRLTREIFDSRQSAVARIFKMAWERMQDDDDNDEGIYDRTFITGHVVCIFCWVTVITSYLTYVIALLANVATS